MIENRIRRKSLLSKITTAEAAASLIEDGMVVGMSGFTRAGDAKAVPIAMVEKAGKTPFKITLITGASLGHDIDRMLTEAAFWRGACRFRWTEPCGRRSTAAR